jgi:hypothetical protein
MDGHYKTVRYQFRRNGLVHRADVYESVHNRVIHVSPVINTLCGKNAIGGGWGYGQPDCQDCMKVLEDRKATAQVWSE